MEVKKHIEEILPTVDPPSLFGMHPNAEVQCNRDGSSMLFNDLKFVVKTGQVMTNREQGDAGGADAIKRKKMKSRSRNRSLSTGNATPDDVVSVVANQIMDDLPEVLKTDRAHSSHTSRNVDGTSNAHAPVLFMEIKKFNDLLAFVFSTLEDLQQAVLGEIAMSSAVEEVRGEGRGGEGWVGERGLNVILFDSLNESLTHEIKYPFSSRLYRFTRACF